MIPTSTAAGASDGPSAFGRTVLLALPALWIIAVVALDFVTPGGVHLVQLLAAAPAIACAGSGRRQCVLLGGVCALLALVPIGADGKPEDYGSRLGTVLAILAVIVVSYLISGRRLRLQRELDRIREVAAAAQRVLLRPLPARIEGLSVAADYLSASSGAQVGGDLYEVLSTPYGVRLVLGDVRGHGLAAIGTVAALLGSFRECAYDEPELGGVLRRLDRALGRHLRERSRGERPAAAAGPDAPVAEEFVTLLLLELRGDGSLAVLNCGHPWPYRVDVSPGRPPWASPLDAGDPLPPLGILAPAAERLPVHHTVLLPGQGLFLHTDGAQDARDRTGAFFPLPQAVSRAVQSAVPAGVLSPALLISEVRTALLAHAGGRLTDDAAMLALCRDRVRVPAQSAGLCRGAPIRQFP